MRNNNWLASSHGRGHRFEPCAVHHPPPCVFKQLHEQPHPGPHQKVVNFFVYYICVVLFCGLRAGPDGGQGVVVGRVWVKRYKRGCTRWVGTLASHFVALPCTSCKPHALCLPANDLGDCTWLVALCTATRCNRSNRDGCDCLRGALAGFASTTPDPRDKVGITVFLCDI